MTADELLAHLETLDRPMEIDPDFDGSCPCFRFCTSDGYHIVGDSVWIVSTPAFISGPVTRSWERSCCGSCRRWNGVSGNSTTPLVRMRIPMPTFVSEEVFPALIADIQSRSDLGLARYGKPLETFSLKGCEGPSLQDVYEECLDMAVYLKRELMERAAVADHLEAAINDSIFNRADPYHRLQEVLTWLRGDSRYDFRKDE